jgi:sigma-B regulation protein RsbQ
MVVCVDADVLTRNNVTLGGQPDGQPIVFAHGYGCDQNMWRFVTPAFADRYRTVLFDFVGAGGSDLSAYDRQRYANLLGYAADVLDVVRAQDLQDVIFVGHSVSAMIGVLAANREPARFAALGWSSTMAPVIMGNGDRPELGAELTASFCRTDPEIAKRFARATFLSDNRADLARVRLPTLVLQCSDDPIAPDFVGEYVHAQIPASTLVRLRATGHCPNLSAPAETVAAIADFVRALPPPAAQGGARVS